MTDKVNIDDIAGAMAGRWLIESAIDAEGRQGYPKAIIDLYEDITTPRADTRSVVARIRGDKPDDEYRLEMREAAYKQAGARTADDVAVVTGVWVPEELWRVMGALAWALAYDVATRHGPAVTLEDIDQAVRRLWRY